MASPTLLALPLELRERIYDFVLQSRQPFATPWSKASFASNVDSPGYGERPVAYLLPIDDEKGHRIFSTIALERSCQQIRCETQSYLRTAVIDMIVKVETVAYDHVSSFLQTLPPAALQRFTVRPESSPAEARKLRVELAGSFNELWTLNLTCWCSVVSSLLKPHEELATAYKIVPNERCDAKWNRAPRQKVAALYQMHRGQQPGPVKEELWKIMLTFWGRFQVEWALRHDGRYTMGNFDSLDTALADWAL